ncbi:MAG: HD-GYP domain-containing protein, partial [Anaerolineae bacterium]|nr:HD-GYP domain-containing protein [Anaerolineae bacterium]
MRNQEALQMLLQVRSKDDYTAEHGLNVCIMAALFGRHLGLLGGEIEKLALSG